MQRHETGLRAKCDDRQQEDAISCRRGQTRGARAQVRERGRVGTGGHHQEHRNQQHEPEVRHGGVPQARFPRVAVLALRQHEEVRRNRHQFPRQQKCENIPGARDEAHSKKKAVEHEPEGAQRTAAVVGGRIGDPVNRGRKTHRGNQSQEERAKQIEPNRDAAGGGGQIRKNGFKRAVCGKNGQSCRKARGAPDDGTNSGDHTDRAGRWRHQRETRAAHVTRNHHPERDADRVHQRA